jgi:glutathione S-transferase
MSARRLYELAGVDPARRFSPFCWRTRMALRHKRLDYEGVPWRFTETKTLGDLGAAGRVPVLVDDGRTVHDSWTIANYLEDAYPDRPSLFGGTGGRALCRFVNAWVDTQLHLQLIGFLARDIIDVIGPEDQAYFRESREKRFGKRLEEFVGDRDAKLPALRQSLTPLRLALQQQPFLAGEAPAYADYIVFGAFMWARGTSAFRLLQPDDPVHGWRERMLGLYDGEAAKAPGYPL